MLSVDIWFTKPGLPYVCPVLLSRESDLLSVPQVIISVQTFYPSLGDDILVDRPRPQVISPDLPVICGLRIYFSENAIRTSGI